MDFTPVGGRIIRVNAEDTKKMIEDGYAIDFYSDEDENAKTR